MLIASDSGWLLPLCSCVFRTVHITSGHFCSLNNHLLQRLRTYAALMWAPSTLKGCVWLWWRKACGGVHLFALHNGEQISNNMLTTPCNSCRTCTVGVLDLNPILLDCVSQQQLLFVLWRSLLWCPAFSLNKVYIAKDYQELGMELQHEFYVHSSNRKTGSPNLVASVWC